MTTTARRRRESGFTLVEVLLTVSILGIIIVPLGNFMLQYLDNYSTTLTRLSDSHDVQIATAYFAQDVANTGVRDSSGAPAQSVRTAPTGTYCGSGLGSTVLVLDWNDWTLTGSLGSQTGARVVRSAAYVVEDGTLHRIYCADGTTPQSDATVVHNLVGGASAVIVQCPGAPTCNAATPPATITMQLTIKRSADDPGTTLTLTGQRRQASS